MDRQCSIMVQLAVSKYHSITSGLIWCVCSGEETAAAIAAAVAEVVVLVDAKHEPLAVSVELISS